MDYMDERKEIIETCHLMCELGYFIGTWGNVSMRVGDHILLTPSKVDYDAMRPEDIVVIDMEGNKISGDRNATSEKEVHRQVYLVRDDIGGIIHTHTVNAMALSATDLDEIPCLVEEMSQVIGGSLPLTKQYVPAGEHVKLGEATAEVIGDRMAVIIKNHGGVACGKTLKDAVLTAKVVEKASQLYIAARTSGHSLSAIPDNFVESEYYRYRFKYGNEKT